MSREAFRLNQRDNLYEFQPRHSRGEVRGNLARCDGRSSILRLVFELRSELTANLLLGRRPGP